MTVGEPRVEAGSPQDLSGSPASAADAALEAASPPPAEPVPAGAEEVSTAPAEELPALLESLLFVAPSPTSVAHLAQALGAEETAVESALAQLAAAYATERRGLRLLRRGDRVNLTSAPESAPYIERFLGLDLSTKLSPAALETLAVIAYRQPLTRADIEAIRGVNCDGVVRTLVSRELVEAVGRLEQPGRPFVYGTTLQFLQYFGLESLDRLPPLPGDAS